MSAIIDLVTSLEPADWVVLSAAMTAFLSVVAIWNALLVKDPMAGRLKTVGRRRDDLKRGLLAGEGNRNRRNQEALTVMNRVIHRFDLMRSRQAEIMGIKLAQAGWRSKDALIIFLFCKLALPLVFAGIAALLLFGLDFGQLEKTNKLIAALFAVIAGAYAPELYVKNTRQKRQQALQKGLPDALDLLVICAEAGLALDAALERVARETGPACPELAEEFAVTAVELGFLPNRRQALENLDQRTDLPSVRGVVNTLLQTEKYGTPLSQALRVLSAEFRNERLLKAEEKAARLPALLTMPLILFILPPLFVVLLGPAALRTIDVLSGVT